MISERWLIDVNAIPESATAISADGRLYVAWSAIVNTPTVDAVEVVRCKDCKNYWKNVNIPGYSGKCTTVNDDDFCSHGERKDNE